MNKYYTALILRNRDIPGTGGTGERRKTQTRLSLLATGFADAVDQLNVFISGIESGDHYSHCEVTSLGGASRTVGQKLTDGRAIKWEEVKS